MFRIYLHTWVVASSSAAGIYLNTACHETAALARKAPFTIILKYSWRIAKHDTQYCDEPAPALLQALSLPPFQWRVIGRGMSPCYIGLPQRWETIFHSGPGNAIKHIHEQHGLNPPPGTKFMGKGEEGVSYMMKNGSQWVFPMKGPGKGVNFPSFDSPVNPTPDLRER